MSKYYLLHGSDHVITTPTLSQGKNTNDYGKGFYCTKDLELAKELACKNNTDGFVNEYDFDDDGLRILNLLDGNHSILNWIALLLEHRIFTINDEIAKDAKDYIIENFSIDTSLYDVIIGYRADDSYFSYAQSFISNTLSLRTLSIALTLGKLGEQTVLISEKAFKQLKFVKAIKIEKETYYQKFFERDNTARSKYHNDIKNKKMYKDNIFILDILREEIKNNDPRIQRIILK